ncbi:MAG: hypothetical protein ABI600_06005 [Luteolibacter sp.]
MKSLPIIALLLGTSFSFAQNAASNQNKEDAVTRDVRFVIAGTRPLPVFKMQGNESVEVDPPSELIPPTAIEILSGKEDLPASTKTPTKIVASTNMIAPLPGLKSVSKIRLKLSRPMFDSAASQEVECDLGDIIRPLIVISASPGKGAWDSPQVRVIDVSNQAFPIRHAMLINLSSIPLMVGIDATTTKIDPTNRGLFPLAPGDAPTRYRVDAIGPTGSVTIANSAYRVGANSRLIMMAIPDRSPQGQAPISLRMVTDAVQSIPINTPAVPR